MKKNLNNQGFTLIELVIVIIILGILSASAVPKFISLKRESIIASMQHLQGVIKSASQLVYLKSATQGRNNSSSSTITVSDETIDTVYGYPAGTAEGIVKIIDNNADDWDNNIQDGDWHSRKSTHFGAWVYWHGSFDEDAGHSIQCYIRYNQATSTAAPTIDMEITDC